MTEAPGPVYLRRNPFPATATTSQDERPADTTAGYGVLALPTVELPAVRQVWKAARAYLNGFADGRQASYGQVAFVHGDHGAGKTHAVLHSLGRAPEVDSTPGSLPYRFYVKAEDDNFVACYRRLMGQLNLTALRDISLRYLGMIAGEETGKVLGEEAEDRFVAQVRKEPDQVYSLYEKLRVEPGAVLEAQASELAGVVGGIEDFQRALTFLLDPALQDAAYAWLVGREVTAAEATRLGVSEPITDPRLCRYGIQLLVSLCARIRRPVIIVLDQCERLIFDPAGTLCMPNVGLLHSLVEVVPQGNGMLILVSSDDAWSALPRDFRQRIGSNDVPAVVLTPDQAVELLAAYVGAVTGKTLAGDPFPFNREAVYTLLELSGGNTRRLLQQAWEVFDQAPGGPPITPVMVKRTAGRGRGSLGEADAELAIERVLADVNVTFERAWRQGTIHAEYAIPAGTEPRVLIRILHAVFYDDEAREALGHANLMRQVQRQGLTARVVLVILGYCSPDVLGRLEQAAHNVIVYDGPAAAEQLRGIVGPVSRHDTQVAAIDHGRLDEVYDALQEAAETRAQEVRALRDELSAVLGRFATASASERTAWAQRQQQLRDRIRDERKARRSQEIADLEAAHAEAERDRRTRFLIGGAMAGLPLVVLGTLMTSWSRTATQGLGAALVVIGLTALVAAYARIARRRAWSSALVIAFGSGLSVAAAGSYLFWIVPRENYYTNTVPISEAVLIFLGSAIGGSCFLAGFSVLRTRRARELGRLVDSEARLTQAARMYLGAGLSGAGLSGDVPAGRRLTRSRPEDLLRHPDPHFRYAGVIAAQADPYRYRQALATLFMTEPTAVLRRSAARAASDAIVERLIRNGLQADIPETVYLVEAADYRAISWLLDSGSAATVAVFLARARRTEPGAVQLLMTVAETLNHGADSELPGTLKSWYLNEEEFLAGLPLRQIPERFLRQATSLLSPFEEGGLGTFDDLALIREVDDVYLFFEQLSFYRELVLHGE